MKLQKAKEIIELNIKEAGNKMPPDVKTALQIAAEALKQIIAYRKNPFYITFPTLPGETEE